MKISKEKTAEIFIQEYGDEALLKATFCAYAAIKKKDIMNCIRWRDIINAIELKQNENIKNIVTSARNS